MSSTVLALKNGSSGVVGHVTVASLWRAVQRSIFLTSSTTSAWRSSSRKPTLHNPITGWDCPSEAATASCAFSSARARCRRATRSRGRNGQSAAALSTQETSGRLAAAQSREARMPASGPAKFSTVSAMTGRPNAAKRAGSPLALRMSPSHCGSSRAITRARMVRPPIWRIGLSPPPIRRARPPASSTPGVAGASLDVAGASFDVAGASFGVAGNSVVTVAAFALVARRFFFDESKILIVDDALLARRRDEPFSPRAPDQRQSDLPRQIDAPGGETRTRNQNGNPHPHGLDHHLGSQPSRGVENLVGRIDAVAVNPPRDLVDGVVAADVFGVADRRAFLAQYAAVDRPGLEVERRHGVDRVGHLIEPGCPQFRLGQRNAFHGFQQVAERCALGAARGLRALLELLLKIGVVFSAYDHHLQIVVIFDLGDDVVVFQHVLIEQIA